MNLSEWPKRFLRVTASGSYNPQIDGLRFLAIVPVLVWHGYLRALRGYTQGHPLSPAEQAVTAWVPNGHIGVLLFFFVSGYMIAFPFLKGRTPSLGSFYKRRLMRLAPPYVLMLTVCLALVSIAPVPKDAATFHAAGGTNFESYLASLFYLHGLIYGYNPRLLPPAWSLEIEFQFYLIAPFLLAAYTRARTFATRAWLVTVSVTVLIVVVNLLEESWGPRGLQRWLVIGHLYPFLLGFLMCDMAERTRLFTQPRDRTHDVGLLVGLLGLAMMGSYYEVPLTLAVRILRDITTVPLVLLVFWGAARGRIGHRVLGNPWLTLIGGACYSIYLVHVPLMYLLAAVIGRVIHPATLAGSTAIMLTVLIPASLLVGFAYYLAIERPCMERDWPTRLRRRLMGASPTAPAPAGSTK